MKNAIRRALNLGLYLVSCFMLGTGLMLAYRLPPGSRGGRGLAILGYDRHDWGDLHFYLGLAFVTLILVHLVINWAWLRKIAGWNRHWPLWLGLAGGVIIIAICLLLPVEQLSRRGW